ncbi:MAG: hypothetical protein IKC50_04335 [Oscillospiraceae bacterium]|nr:hypothetical protein [Oscillospiraceae bacterium]
MKIRILLILACCLLLTACDRASIGIIGGADGPTSIIVGKISDKVSGRFGDQLEKKPIRMFNVDGELYYDSGLVSENTPRCGTMDGTLKKAVKENELPLTSGEANFAIDGYQHATSITKEAIVDGEWHIFKKYEAYEHALEDMRYCYYIKGRMKNAAADSEFVVLTDNADVTFDDVISPMLSIVGDRDEKKGRILFNRFRPDDEWGISLSADRVTPTGLILRIEQFGGSPTGSLEYGPPYFLETTVDDVWQEVKTKTGEPLVWNMPSYRIARNDVTEEHINWEFGYGALQPGFYRLKKTIMDFRDTGDFDEKTYEVYFTVEPEDAQ